MQIIININADEQVLIEKSGRDLEAEMLGKKEEIVNLGRQAKRNEVLELYEKADPIKKAEFEALVEEVKVIEESKTLKTNQELI